MMSDISPDRVRKIKTFPSLVKFLREELNWKLEEEDIDDLTFEYEPEELGIDPKSAVKIREIKQLRPFAVNQPWGIFYLSFEPKRLPVAVLRRVLRALVLKRRQSANPSSRPAWELHDLLFISSYGEENTRAITFVHFREDGYSNLPSLKVIGWDVQDTPLHIDQCIQELGKLRFDAELSPEAWREQWSSAFTLRHREVISTSKQLASELAALAGQIRKRISAVLNVESKQGPVRSLYKACQETLLHDLTEERFADMFAQTVAYGLFSARCSRPAGLIADNLTDMIPESNLFLRELLSTFFSVGGKKGKIDFDEFGINDVVEMLRDANMEAVLRDFGDKNPQEDPVIHFYEGFLKQYDADQKIKRGAFYTPRPVVSFIVRSVHEILKRDFGLKYGLADTTTWGEMAERSQAGAWERDILIPERVSKDAPFVQILDPAVGTGTFLVEVIDLIHKTMAEKWETEGENVKECWNDYVPKHLLPRLYGFELMMAPYNIAHVKIALKLIETGYQFKMREDEVIRIYLTNSLEPAKDTLPDYLEAFSPALAHEAKAANQIKQSVPFTVVIGNPPYSVSSSNKSLWIEKLTADYKKDLNERNIQPLSDDYIKFIRFGQHLIDKNGEGILGYISNNSFIDGIIHRQMRRYLLESFDKSYISDLHGNAKKKESAPDGSKDENVFDIMQGVSINLFVKEGKKNKNKLGEVFHFDLQGKRESKYKFLHNSSLKSIKWTELKVKEPNFFFVEKDFSEEFGYNLYFKVNELFIEQGSGIKFRKDNLLVKKHFTKESVKNMIIDMQKLKKEDIFEKYDFNETQDWIFEEQTSNFLEYDDSEIRKVLYRPFDNRYTFYPLSKISKMIPRGDSRKGLMQHLLKGENLSLLSCRQQSTFDFQHVLISNNLIDMCAVSLQTKETTYVFPLYLYPEITGLTSKDQNTNRKPNLNKEIVQKIADKLGLKFTDEKDVSTSSTSAGTFAPIDILDYIYAVLHCPSYREKYKEFLKIDFPRVPYPEDAQIFWQLVKFGSELRLFHLLEHPKTAQFITTYPKAGSNLVVKIRYESGKVHINEDQYFDKVPQIAWEFYIGGYQPAQKWLKDRKGRTLNPEDIRHYHRIVVALNETIRIMQEIDETIEAQGGFPIQ